MKIGIDCRMYGPRFTGIGRYTYELVQHLAALDTETEYVCFLNQPEYETFQAPGKNFRAAQANASHYSLKEQTSFLHTLKSEQLDLMHFTHFNAPLLYTRPTVVTIHDLTLSIYPGKKMTSLVHRLAYNLVIRRSVAHAKRIIAVSENTKRDVTKFLGTDPAHITTVHNGINREFAPCADRQAAEQALKQYGITGDFLLYTGVWRDHKNILGLLEALALLKEKSFVGQLVITGKPDPVYAPAIYEKVEKLGLKDSVIFPGLVPDADLQALYHRARVFVFPSFYEGFGLPPLEAMAAGIPVAVSNTSCMPEVCGEGNAVFFDPHDPRDMAENIMLAWNDEVLRQELIERGKKRAAEFSWKKMAEETLAVYRAAAK